MIVDCCSGKAVVGSQRRKQDSTISWFVGALICTLMMRINEGKASDVDEGVAHKILIGRLLIAVFVDHGEWALSLFSGLALSTI